MPSPAIVNNTSIDTMTRAILNAILTARCNSRAQARKRAAN